MHTVFQERSTRKTLSYKEQIMWKDNVRAQLNALWIIFDVLLYFSTWNNCQLPSGPFVYFFLQKSMNTASLFTHWYLFLGPCIHTVYILLHISSYLFTHACDHCSEKKVVKLFILVRLFQSNKIYVQFIGSKTIEVLVILSKFFQYWFIQ